MAKCCNPVPGEAVVGFVTRGRGITVHTLDCPIAQDQPEERRVEVEWELSASAKMVPTEVTVRIADRKGILAEITTVMNSLEINIDEVHSKHRPDDTVDLQFVLQIRDIDQLTRVLAETRKLKGVLSVERAHH